MRSNTQNSLACLAVAVCTLFAIAICLLPPRYGRTIVAQNSKSTAIPVPTPEFDRRAAITKLREQIKGREEEPAEKVFKNIRDFKGLSAKRLMVTMQIGYSRALGVDCTHCHIPEKWESDEKPAKRIAREMSAMSGQINRELLGKMEGLSGRRAIVTCTTCHRGELKPALDMPRPNP